MDDTIRWLLVVGGLMAGASGIVLIATRPIAGGRAFIAKLVGRQELWFAFAVGASMMLGSLFLSEALHYLPCKLCWYQRICAYPLGVILGWGAFRRDRNAWAPALTLATVGSLVSAWHIAIDRIPGLDTGSCDPAVPCTVRWKGFDNEFGFVTIQVLALCCFLFIIGMGLHALARPVHPFTESEAELPADQPAEV